MDIGHSACVGSTPDHSRDSILRNAEEETVRGEKRGDWGREPALVLVSEAQQWLECSVMLLKHRESVLPSRRPVYLRT